MSGVILDGYWYYTHSLKYDYQKHLQNADFYYKSAEDPKYSDYPKNVELVKENYKFIEDFDDTSLYIHVFRINKSDDVYLFIYKWGWKRISKNDLNVLADRERRVNKIKKIYNK